MGQKAGVSSTKVRGRCALSSPGETGEILAFAGFHLSHPAPHPSPVDSGSLNMAPGHFHRQGTSESWERKSFAQHWWESWWQSQVDPNPRPT